MTKISLAYSLLFSFALPAPAMVVREFEALRHERFYSGNDKSFVGDPFDFSGVGTTGGTWATLVSDSYFITASHFHPGINDTVVFYEGNDLTGPSHSYTVMGGQRIGDTDLWIGWFDSTVDASIARYPILDLPSDTDYLGLAAYNYGREHRVGMNVIEDVQLVSPDFPNSVVFIYDYDNNDMPSVGGNETFLETGDSGAPTFSIVNGCLALTGIHAGIDSPFFADSAVPAYVDEINDVLSGKGQQLALVPEPSISLLFLGGFAILAATVRRTKNT